MIRAQCIVTKKDKLLMIQHQEAGVSWWCLPGGGVEVDETAAEAALRELGEECCVEGEIIRQVNIANFADQDDAITFLVEIGDQEPKKGSDPEFPADGQIIENIAWLSLSEIPERDRAFLWGAGLLSLPAFLDEVASWGDDISYPGVD